VTNPGGEVIALDSAGYGAFTVTQAVTIQAPNGVYAGVTAFAGDGIDVNAGPSDIVILRGLALNAQGGTNGIVQNSSGTLHIENCVINGFTSGAGIAFNGLGSLQVNDSTIRNNNDGIAVAPFTPTATASIENVRLKGNVNGLHVKAGSIVAIRNSVASGNTIGLWAEAGNDQAELNVESCMVTENSGVGIQATNPGGFVDATCRVSNTLVSRNGTGLQGLAGGPFHTGKILSRGNNTVEGNVTNTSGIVSSYSSK
jgi:hypothetical protein